jgi:transposase
VRCPVHGVVVAAVPWARHDAGHTFAFDDQVAWLATHCSKLAVCQLMRIAWATVGAIVERVVADARSRCDPFEGLRRIGIDEISYRRGQRYLSVVVDHDSGRLLWVAPGRDEHTLAKFFTLLGPERCAQLRLISADAGSWIASAVRKYCPNAELCLDPFHVVSWATDALDDLRREVWNTARHNGQQAAAADLKGARWALWKNPADITAHQQAQLADIARTNRPLYRGYLLKEQLRQVFQLPHQHAMALLRHWLSWARRCRLAPFVRLAKTITAHLPDIEAALLHRLSNARIEAVNTRIRLITRRAFGFRSSDALIALAMLSLGGFCPDLPGR